MRHLTITCTALALITCVAATEPARAWNWSPSHDDSRCSDAANAAVDPHGDMIVAGQSHLADGEYCEDASAPAVVKLAGATGALLWRTEGDFARCSTAYVVGIRADGDVIVQYRVHDCDEWQPRGSEVLRLAAASGEVRWRRSFDGDPETPESPGTVDAAGNVIVTDGGAPVKLSGDDGSVLWRADEAVLDGDRRDRRLLAGPTGQVILIQSRRVPTDATSDWTGAPSEAVALGNDDGQVRWRVGLWGVQPQADLDAAGNLAVSFAGYWPLASGPSWHVFELAAADGSIAWDATADVVAAFGSGEPNSLAVATDGTIVVAGDIATKGSGTDFAVVAFDGATGARRWQYVHGGTARLDDHARMVIVDGDGDLVVTGFEQKLMQMQRRPDKLGPRSISTIRKLRFTDGTLRWLRQDPSESLLAGPQHLFVLGRAMTVWTLNSDNGGNLPCGNGVVEGREECDDGNGQNDDGCDTLCREVVCGDRLVHLGEECDDGNVTAGDGCDTSCTAERTCGEIDLRGQWRSTVTCSGYFQSIEPANRWSFEATADVDIEQDCATGVLATTVRPSDDCARLEGPFGSFELGCAVVPTLTSGVVDDAWARFPAMGGVESHLDLDTPLPLVSCAATSLSTRYAFDGAVSESRLGKAGSIRGRMLNAVTFAEADGRVCFPEPSSFACEFAMEWIGDLPSPPDDEDPPVDPTPPVECRDADPCTIDVVDAGGCQHIGLRGAAALACRQRTGWAGTSCESRGYPKRLGRVLARLESFADSTASARSGRKLLRLLHRANRLAARALERGRVPKACHTELGELLGGMRATES